MVPKNLSTGAHIFEIRPGPKTPPQVFGTEPNPRPYLLYLPSGYRPGTPQTLWVHAPGSAVKMETVFDHNQHFAEVHNIAMVFLSGLSYKMNVVGKALGKNDGFPDDVVYTQVTLRRVFEKINVDKRRVYCVGYSRGARFCSRLASELSVYFAGIAGVAGIRYPVPNNATKPMPVLAVHGVKDWINPYMGGGPYYWGEGMPVTMERWSQFNGCKSYTNETRYEGVELLTHTKCTHNATVVLYKLPRWGHDWPDNLTVSVRHRIKEFFDNHTETVACHTVHEQDVVYHECYKHMQWVRKVGLYEQAFLYDGIRPESCLHDIQELLHERVYANCPMPCPPDLTTDANTVLMVGHASTNSLGETRSAGEDDELLQEKRPKVFLVWMAAAVLTSLSGALVVVAAVQIRRVCEEGQQPKSAATAQLAAAKQLLFSCPQQLDSTGYDLQDEENSPSPRSV